MRDFALTMTLLGMFVAVLSILYVLGTPKRTLVQDTRELTTGDVITLEQPGGRKATVTVLSANPHMLVLGVSRGARFSYTHTALAAQQQAGLRIWKDAPDVQLP